MKQTKTKLLCLLIAALMLLSLAACGKETATEPNLIKLGDRELLYKGACIMEDSSGNDAVVLTLDFTNNGKENASYLWSVDETVMKKILSFVLAFAMIMAVTSTAFAVSYSGTFSHRYDFGPVTGKKYAYAYRLRKRKRVGFNRDIY